MTRTMVVAATRDAISTRVSLGPSFSPSCGDLCAHLNCQRRLCACFDCERNHLFSAQKSTAQIFNDANASHSATGRANWLRALPLCSSNPISLILFVPARARHPKYASEIHKIPKDRRELIHFCRINLQRSRKIYKIHYFLYLFFLINEIRSFFIFR